MPPDALPDLDAWLAEQVVAPVRAQVLMDRAWFEDRARFEARYRGAPELQDLEAMSPGLVGLMAPSRPILAEHEMSCRLEYHRRDSSEFSVAIAPIHSGWEAVFGPDAEPPRIGYSRRRTRSRRHESSLSFTVIQTPAAPPARADRLPG